jgi:hypothetical protein
VSSDLDGYGYDPDQRGIDRLLDDLRTVSPAGVERIAWGWDQHDEGDGRALLLAAEKAALRVLEDESRAQPWEDVQRRVLDMTEGRTSLVAWKAEHGDVGHKAERAVLAAALGLGAGDALPDADRRVLVRAAAEAMPWLLPDEPPEPHAEPGAETGA